MIKNLDLNSITDVILESNQEGNIVDINNAVQDMFGYEPKELIGQPFSILMPKKFRENHDNLFKGFRTNPSARRMGDTTSAKFVGLDKRGQEFYIDISLSAKQSNDNSVSYIAIIRDVSEMVSLNQKMSTTISTLEEKNKELEHMAYMISHDLKAPTRAVTTLINIIEEDHEDELAKDVADYFTEIKSRVSKMSQLIDDILSYSRAGSIATNEEEIDMEGIIKEVLGTIEVPDGFAVRLKTKNFIFSVSKTQFLQVMTNLIGNAIKYHDQDQGNVDIIAKTTIDQIEVKISDDGPGIPAKYHNTIFEMFGTANQIKRSDSTGIGLAIVKKIVTSNGGKIQVKSEIGKGSEFTFTFKINTVANKT